MLSLKPRPSSFNRPSICRRPDSHTCLKKKKLELLLFPSIFCTISAFSLYGEYVDGVFLPFDHGLDFRHHQLMYVWSSHIAEYESTG